MCIQIGQRLFIMDAGTGIHHLGPFTEKPKPNKRGNFHFPYPLGSYPEASPFAPAFIKGNRFVLYGQSKVNSTFADLERSNDCQFPGKPGEMGPASNFMNWTVRSKLDLGSRSACVRYTNHPNGSLAYRLDYDGRSCCYITDTEHYSCVDPRLKAFCRRD